MAAKVVRATICGMPKNVYFELVPGVCEDGDNDEEEEENEDKRNTKRTKMKMKGTKRTK